MSSVVFDRRVSVSHALAAVWRFEDAFSGRVVDVPLDVRVDTIAPAYPHMPLLPWRAVRGDDATYRFGVSGGTVPPVGPLAVTIQIPGAEYAAFESLSMVLPRTVSTPPTRADFLIVSDLWPTRVFRIPDGETAVVGTIRSVGALASVAGLRVTMWSAANAAPPSTPYTYTDANGDFVARLLGPDFRTLVGGVAKTTVDVSIQILTPPTYTTVVAPITPFPQTIQLGQVTSLPIPVR